ncbi:MAG: manganese efflux pump [Lachnospiraceae bacterium]|jgi:putative Mn2+ efflux pump MntP|nr:manganese efflux pump [Lachnospiraceae bacterium]
MSLIELFILAVGLSMDAFAVSICKGLCVPKAGIRECATAGIYFGGFQAFMPFLGFLLGVQFKEYITSIDHWIAFILLGIIGINMIREARGNEEDCEACATDSGQNPFSFKAMLPLAIATSIDALAVGVTLAFLKVELLPAITFIGVITFLISAAGIRIGNLFGSRWKSKAELAGGIILICMGMKILLEHLGILI